MANLPRPPYDQELATALANSPIKLPAIITPSMIPALRSQLAPKVEDILSTHQISHSEHTTTGSHGPITLSVFQPPTAPQTQTKTRPAIIWLHPGAFFSGNRFIGVSSLFKFTTEVNAVIISVEYRLAPENPDPAPLDDCYAGLLWVSDHMAELGINPAKVMVAGSSAGGGLAAGVALYARDHGGPAICAQMLQAPMLDDRLETVSARQYEEDGTFSRGSAETGWRALLGERNGGDQVSVHAAPIRAMDLKGLPEAFIEVGSAEVLRDEDVKFAERLWACGVQAELHVWAGACHGFQAFAPGAKISVAAGAAREAWVRRVFSE